jgi:DNA-binding response OmpR family regulator
MKCGGLIVEPAKHRVLLNGEEIMLPNREFELLVFLMQNRGIVFSRNKLFETIWGLDALGDTATVAVHINRLREKIETDTANPYYIETIRGAGYRFRNKERGQDERMSRWHLAHLSVRKRLLFNNFIMVLVPVLLLVISSTVIFMGLRATGNFRDREIELVWPEAGDSAAIQLGLSHLRAHVDWKWKDNSVGAIHRHVATLERAGIQVAVLDDGAGSL